MPVPLVLTRIHLFLLILQFYNLLSWKQTSFNKSTAGEPASHGSPRGLIFYYAVKYALLAAASAFPFIARTITTPARSGCLNHEARSRLLWLRSFQGSRGSIYIGGPGYSRASLYVRVTSLNRLLGMSNMVVRLFRRLRGSSSSEDPFGKGMHRATGEASRR